MTPTDSHVFFSQWKNSYQIADHAEGVYIYDTNGKRYLDGIGGMFVVTIGHGVPEIADAMAAQARKLCFVHRPKFTTAAQEQLANLIIEMAPKGMDRVFFTTCGATSNETAMQIARQYHLEKGQPGKFKIIGQWHNYHGSTAGALSMSGDLGTRRRMKMEPYFLNFSHVQPPYCYRCPFQQSYPTCALACANDLLRTIEQEGPHTIAAFIATPIIAGTGGAIVPPPDYFKRIREICDTYDILLIMDEVVTGLGRLGKNFGIEHWHIVPDIITVSKTLGSGYTSMGATIVNQRIWETFTQGKRNGFLLLLTYSGYAAGCATALAVQQYLRKHNLVERCAVMGKYLKTQLQKLATREPLIGEVRGEGLFLGLELVQNRETRQSFPRSTQLFEKVLQETFAQGLIVTARTGNGIYEEGDHISIGPPFTVSEAECDEIVGILESSLQRVRQSLKLG